MAKKNGNDITSDLAAKTARKNAPKRNGGFISSSKGKGVNKNKGVSKNSDEKKKTQRVERPEDKLLSPKKTEEKKASSQSLRKTNRKSANKPVDGPVEKKAQKVETKSANGSSEKKGTQIQNVTANSNNAETVKRGLEVAFLGGVGEIGKNMTALICDDDILLIDAGNTFPDESTPGVDAIIPDFSWLRENKERVVGVVLTHGHEDHIGALPYFLKEFNVKVYGSDVTLSLLSAKLEERKLTCDSVSVRDGDKVNIGKFKVEFLHVCHSVSGAFALAITTKYGVIFHSGDFKIDFTPIDGEFTDLRRFASLGRSGVTLMLGESTNVEREGYTVSERAVGDTFDGIFAKNTDRRIIIATFASNINRLQQIVDVAAKYSRRIAFAGRSMLKSFEIGKKLDILHVLPDDVVDLERAVKMPDEKVCIVVTGSQGEPMSALTRMAIGEYNKVAVGCNDTVMISASPIPGNEKSVYNVINNLYKLGARVCYHTLRDLHVSGHAHREELKLMLSLVKPKYFMPVHGEYRHQVKHKELAISLGVSSDNILIPEIGWKVAVTDKGLKRRPDVTAGNSYVEGDEVGDDMENVISDRKLLSEEGLIILVLSFEKGRLLASPDILTRGISVSAEFTMALKDEIAELFDGKKYDPEARGAFKVKLSRLVRSRTRKEMKTAPMVVPIIVEK